MRNPNRIYKFCYELMSYWSKHPDLRFGQIIENMKSSNKITDLFYIEDDEMIKLIKKELTIKNEYEATKIPDNYVDPSWYFDNFIN